MEDRVSYSLSFAMVDLIQRKGDKILKEALLSGYKFWIKIDKFGDPYGGLDFPASASNDEIDEVSFHIHYLCVNELNIPITELFEIKDNTPQCSWGASQEEKDLLDKLEKQRWNISSNESGGAK
jgi:hypothetical protein